MPTKTTDDIKETRKANPLSNVKSFFKDRKKSEKTDKTLRVAHPSLWGKIGFVLGIIGAIAWLSPLIGVVVTIVGLVFSILGLNIEKGRWFAVTGLTLSIVFLNLSFIYGFYNLLMAMFSSTGV